MGSSAEGFLPSKEGKARSLREHPPTLFFSLSLSPHLCVRVGKKILRRRSFDPSSAMPCCEVWELFHPLLWLFAFPSVKPRSWTWWHLTAWSAFFPISVSGLGTPLTILQRHCCFEHVLFRASQHDPPFSWLTTQDFQAGIYSPPHILGASEEADSIPHLPLPPPLGPCARSKLICELHPLGDFSPKWIQPAEVWRFCLLAGGEKYPSPQGPWTRDQTALQNWQASWWPREKEKGTMGKEPSQRRGPKRESGAWSHHHQDNPEDSPFHEPRH